MEPSALDHSREAVRVAKRRRNQRFARLAKAGFHYAGSAYRGLRNSGLQFEDRVGDAWVPREQRVARSIDLAAELVERSDGGLVQAHPGGYVVYAGASRDGRHANVLLDPQAEWGLRCDGSDCSAKVCVHMNIARIHMGLTRLNCPDGGLPMTGKPAMQVGLDVELKPVGSVASRPQGRGERKQTVVAVRQEVPVPLEPVVGRIEFSIGDVRMAAEGVPASLLDRIIDKVHRTAGEQNPVQGNSLLQPEALARALLDRPRGIYSPMDDLLRSAVETWDTLDADAQGRLRARFSQVIQAKAFKDALTLAHASFKSERSPENHRVFLYGVA